MTEEERQKINVFNNALFDRINKAKRAIRECNYGTALSILEEPFPVLQLTQTQD